MAKDEPTKSETPAEGGDTAEASRPKLVRLKDAIARLPAWVNGHRRLSLALTAGLLLLGGVATWWMLRSTEPEITIDQRLAEALKAFDRGDENRARYEATEVNRTPGLSARQVATVAFLFGALAAGEADEALGENRRLRYLVAARYLEQAHARGFPRGYDGLGLYLFGKSLFESGQVSASRPILERAIAAYPQRQTEMHRLLAMAYLHDAFPRLDQALAHAEAYLGDQRLSPQEREDGLLLKAQVLFQQGKLAEAEQTLAAIPARSALESEALLLRARIAMRQAEQHPDENDERHQQLYTQAIKLLEQSQERDTLRTRTTPRAMFLMGRCFQALGDTSAALAQWDRVRKLHFDTPEGMAATFEAADLLLAAGRPDEAIAAYREALQRRADVGDVENPWLTTETLRRRVMLAYDALRDERHFAAVLELVAVMGPLFPATRVLELEAQTNRQWAEDLVRLAETQLPAEAEASRRSARERFRLAGDAFQRLAEARRVTRDYPDDLWNAARSFLDGKAYSTAAILLEEYLEIELRARRPLALVAYGEALLALGRVEDSLAALSACLERYARDASSFDARLLAAQAYLEQGEIEAAERLLLENLEGGLLTPASRQWAEALFSLGRLYYLEGRYDEALRRLDEYVARYDGDDRSRLARYLAGLSARRRAAQLLAELDQEKTETARLASLRVIRGYQTQALERFVQLQTDLNALQSKRPLWDHEQALLRNCYFSRGATLVALERFDEAIDVYASAANRYQHQPVAMEAYVQIAHCYERLGRPLDADGVLAQAQIVLAGTAEDADFQQVTNFSREEWQSVLDAMRTFVAVP